MTVKQAPTAFVDPLVITYAVTFRTEAGQHRMIYTSTERANAVLQLQGERVTGTAVKVDATHWNYNWQDSRGVTKARLFSSDYELEQFVALGPDKD